MSDGTRNDDADRRIGAVEFRSQAQGGEQVTEEGICIFIQQPCLGSVCMQYDLYGEQCGIRSMGVAASAFLQAYGTLDQGEEDNDACGEE